MLCNLKEALQGCWGGVEPPPSTLSPSVTSWEQWVSGHSLGGGAGSVLFPARRGLQGDSQTGGLSPRCSGSPRLHPEEQGSDRVS